MPVRSQSSPSSFRGVLTVVLTLLGWSSVPLFLFHFSKSIDFWTSNGWRYGFSAILWLPVVLAVTVRGRLPRGLWAAAIVPSVANSLGQVCFTWAHYEISPGLLSFGLRSQLVFVAIGAFLLFPAERAVIRRAGYLAGLALLVAGTAAVLASGVLELAGDGGDRHVQARAGLHAPMLGVVLAVGSGMLFAAYGLSVRKFMAGYHPVLAFAAICQYTGLSMVLLMLAFGSPCADGAFAGLRGMMALQLPAEQLLYLLLSAVIGIALGHVFYYISIANLGVAVTAGVLQLQPFIVALAQLWIFGEALTSMQWLGGAVAVLGAMLMLRTQQRAVAVGRDAALRADAELRAEAESGA
ncbi:MAG: DMT family transporter [Phycisphaerales bacterium]